MMNLSCEYCGKEGTLEEQVYAGKRLRLKCPYCAGSFVFKVSLNGNWNPNRTVAAAPMAVPPDRTVAALATVAPVAVSEPPVIPAEVEQPAAETLAPVAEEAKEVDEALVHEAKRIARLIISEIKLYNQDKIVKARNKREVLELLKHDLIKGKQHYNTRIASKLPTGPDFFMETVKEILLAGKS